MLKGVVCCKTQINLVDTVILERGEVVMYLYTNTDGIISKKPVGLNNFLSMRDAFFGFLEHLQPDGYKHVAVCHSSGTTGGVCLDGESFNALCMGNPSEEVEVLQAFVPSKGDTGACVTFRCVSSVQTHACSV